MLVPLFFGIFIEAVFSSPVILDRVLDSAPLGVFGRSIVEQCITTANSRSLYEIVRSCAATTFACTWVSMHKNVPAADISNFRVLLERLLLLDYAVVAPECVTIWAYRQHLAAARHVEEFNAAFKCESLINPLHRHHLTLPTVTPESSTIFQSLQRWLCCPRNANETMQPWTLAHGFLLEMGALVILRDGRPPEVVKEVKQLKGLFDDHPDTPPNIPLDMIDERSRGNPLAKLLAILQTSWFLFQCAARWASRLDVTELETLTLAFAFLNGLTYAFWWEKPLEMNSPIEIDLRSSAALRISGVSATQGLSAAEKNNHKSIGVTIREARAPSPHSPLPPQNRDHDEHSLSPSKHGWCMTIVYIPKSALNLFRLYFVYPFYAMCESDEKYMNTSTGQLVYTSGDGISAPASPSHWLLKLAFYVVICIFGGIHFIPIWLSHFPTSVERWFWFGCAVWVTIHPVLILAEVVISKACGSPSFSFFVQYGFPVYGAARICFLILALIALRQLPCSTYEPIYWASFVPHI